MTVQSSDGAVYTGFALVDRNRIVVLLAVRETGERPSPAATTRFVEPVREQSRYASSAMSMWEHEHRDRLDEPDDWSR